LGVPVGKLRELGAAGEITAEKLFRALQASGAALTAEFEKMPVTVGGATTRVSNSILQLIGTLDQLTGTSSAVSGWASKVAASLDGINGRVSKSGGIWRGYVDAISEDFARARLEATRAELDRMAGAVKNAQDVLSKQPDSIYAKDTLREFSELNAAVKKYEADIKRIQGIDVSAKATAQPGGRQRDISSATVASVSAALAREQTALAARKEFLKDYASAEEKFTAELKKQKEAQGDLFTPEDEARLRKKFFPEKKGATLDFVKGDVGSVQRELDTLTNTYANAERVLEATRNAGLISERKYYDEKLIFLELNTAAQVASLKAENDAIEARARKGQKGLDDDRKVADNLAQIRILQDRAATSAHILGQEQTTASDKVKKGYEEARIAAQQYLDTVAKQNQREIAAAAFGPKAQGRARERGQIEDKFQGQINDAYADNRRGQLKDDDLQNRLSNLKQMQEAEIALAEEKYAALDALDKSWQAGLSISVNTYLDETANISKQVQSLVGQTTKGLEDAFVDFAMTGKASFSDLASSFIRELLRMEARAAISAIFRAIVGDQSGGAGGGAGGLFGALFGAVAGPKAIGGPVSAGSMYQVNERGPELLNAGGKQYLMMGSQSGSVTPNNGLRGGDSTTINVAAGPTRNEVMTAIQLGMQAVRSETDVKLRKAGILR
jgi:lambda family phage tail tape measure protein